MFRRFICLLLLIPFSLVLCGFIIHDPEEQIREEIQAVLRGVTAAWEQCDTAAFRKYYAPDKGTRMIEGGGQNIGVDDLILHHVLPHHEEFAALGITINDTDVHFLGSGYTNAWAIQDFDVLVKTKAGKESRATGYETFILQRFNGKWKIVHSHSSTRSMKTETK